MGAALLGCLVGQVASALCLCIMPGVFTFVLGDQTQVLILTWQALYKLSISSGPQRVCLFHTK